MDLRILFLAAAALALPILAGILLVIPEAEDPAPLRLKAPETASEHFVRRETTELPGAFAAGVATREIVPAPPANPPLPSPPAYLDVDSVGGQITQIELCIIVHDEAGARVKERVYCVVLSAGCIHAFGSIKYMPKECYQLRAIVMSVPVGRHEIWCWVPERGLFGKGAVDLTRRRCNPALSATNPPPPALPASTLRQSLIRYRSVNVTVRETRAGVRGAILFEGSTGGSLTLMLAPAAHYIAPGRSPENTPGPSLPTGDFELRGLPVAENLDLVAIYEGEEIGRIPGLWLSSDETLELGTLRVIFPWLGFQQRPL